MGARSGGGARQKRQVITFQDVIAAQKAMSSFKAQVTKAQNARILAEGAILTAQNEEAKAKARKAYEKAIAQYKNAVSSYDTAAAVLAAKRKAYESSYINGKKVYADEVDIDIPLF